MAARQDLGRAGRRSAQEHSLGVLRQAAGPTDVRRPRPLTAALLVPAVPAAGLAVAVAAAPSLRAPSSAPSGVSSGVPAVPPEVTDLLAAAAQRVGIGPDVVAGAVAGVLVVAVLLLTARLRRRTRRWFGVFEGGLVLVQGRREPVVALWRDVEAVQVRPRAGHTPDVTADSTLVVHRQDRRTWTLHPLPAGWPDAARAAAAEHAISLVEDAVVALSSGRDVVLPGAAGVRLTPAGVDLGSSVVSWQILGAPFLRPHGRGRRLDVLVEGDPQPRASLALPAGLHSGLWALHDLLAAGSRSLAVPDLRG